MDGMPTLINDSGKIIVGHRQANGQMVNTRRFKYLGPAVKYFVSLSKKNLDRLRAAFLWEFEMHPLDILAYQKQFKPNHQSVAKTYNSPPRRPRPDRPNDWCRIAKEARQKAIENGEKTYQTGWACRNGHIAPQSTTTQKCIVCAAEYYKKKGKQ